MNENKQLVIRQEIPEADLSEIKTIAIRDTEYVRIVHEYNDVPVCENEIPMSLELANERLSVLMKNEREAKSIITSFLSPFTNAKRFLEEKRKEIETDANVLLNSNRLAQSTITAQMLTISKKQKEAEEKEKARLLQIARQKAEEERLEAERLRLEAEAIARFEKEKLVSAETLTQAEAIAEVQEKNAESIQAIVEKIEEKPIEIKNYSVTSAGSISTKLQTSPTWTCVDLEKLIESLPKLLSLAEKQKLLKDITPAINSFVKQTYKSYPEKFDGKTTIYGIKLSTTEEIKKTLR